MHLSRRNFFRLGATASLLPSIPRFALAQTYPSRPVRVVVGFAAGGPVDIVARIVGQRLSERLGQTFVIENRPGAAGNLATEAVANSPPDGYTLLLLGASNTINPSLYEKLKFNFLRDVAPIASIMRSTLILVVSPTFSPKSVSEFIAYAKANPGKINIGSGGTGTSSHMACELFKAMANVNMQHLPYRGEAPGLNDLIGGQIQAMFANMSSSLEFVTSGKLRALAVTTAARSERLPELPTVGEFVTGFEVSGMNGFGGPRTLPTEVVEKLNREVNAILVDPKLRGRLLDLGGTPLPGSPAEYGNLLSAEVEKWNKLIRAANIKPD